MFSRFQASDLAEFEKSHQPVPTHFQAHYENGPWFSTNIEGARRLAARPDANTITLLPVSIDEAE